MDDETPIVVVQETNVSLVTDQSEAHVIFDQSGLNMVEISSPGPQGPAGVGVEEDMYDMEIDSSNPAAVYIGYAQPGTAKSDASWRIKKVSDTGTTVSIEWAGGTAGFNNVWSDRASYTYGP